MKILPTEFDGQATRRVYDEATEIWWFSVVDVVQVLTQQLDDLTARKYWNQLKRRLANEGSQLVTACHQLKMPAADGKQRLTDVATAETLLRLVQSVPSPKAEPIKLWLAKVVTGGNYLAPPDAVTNKAPTPTKGIQQLKAKTFCGNALRFGGRKIASPPIASALDVFASVQAEPVEALPPFARSGHAKRTAKGRTLTPSAPST